MSIGHMAKVHRAGPGQLAVYIPKRIRDALGIEAGDAIEFVVEAGETKGVFLVHKGTRLDRK